MFRVEHWQIHKTSANPRGYCKTENVEKKHHMSSSETKVSQLSTYNLVKKSGKNTLPETNIQRKPERQ